MDFLELFLLILAILLVMLCNIKKCLPNSDDSIYVYTLDEEANEYLGRIYQNSLNQNEIDQNRNPDHEEEIPPAYQPREITISNEQNETEPPPIYPRHIGSV